MLVLNADGTVTTQSRNTKLLLRVAADGQAYEVFSDNPSTRAWNGAMGGYRRFATLDEVESHYKAFKGISALIDIQNQVNLQ